MNSKGVLGDMVVDITIGDARQPALEDGATIRTAEAASLSRTLEEVEQVIGGVQTLVSDVNARVRETLTPQIASDVGRITHSTAELLEGVEQGGGLAHQVIYDKRLAADATATVRDAQHASERLGRSLARVDELLTRVRDGDGLLHGLIYADGGTQTAEDFRRLASDFAAVSESVRRGPSLAHSVLYDPDQAELVDDLGQMARILRRLAEEMDEGKGTVGGLLKDPTAYQNLTELLGNLKRNALLKAAIRLTIQKDSLVRPSEPAYGGSGMDGGQP
jgi:phospholipid/cholesterol/gamma-HCH transport system substrate-binding protein